MSVSPGSWQRTWARYSGAVTTKALLLYGAYRLGVVLDARWHTFPLATGVLVVAASALGIAFLIYISSRR